MILPRDIKILKRLRANKPIDELTGGKLTALETLLSEGLVERKAVYVTTDNPKCPDLKHVTVITPRGLDYLKMRRKESFDKILALAVSITTLLITLWQLLLALSR